MRVEGYGIDLETTEAAFLQDIEGTTRKLTELRSAGWRVALVNFGTGYSPLGILPKLPLDIVKIGRPLIRRLPHDPTARALVDSIIRLGSALGMVSVEQLDEPGKLKCCEWEGSLFRPSVRAAELEQLLHQHVIRAAGEADFDRSSH